MCFVYGSGLTNASAQPLYFLTFGERPENGPDDLAAAERHASSSVGCLLHLRRWPHPSSPHALRKGTPAEGPFCQISAPSAVLQEPIHRALKSRNSRLTSLPSFEFHMGTTHSLVQRGSIGVTRSNANGATQHLESRC